MLIPLRLDAMFDFLFGLGIHAIFCLIHLLGMVTSFPILCHSICVGFESCCSSVTNSFVGTDQLGVDLLGGILRWFHFGWFNGVWDWVVLWCEVSIC